MIARLFKFNAGGYCLHGELAYQISYHLRQLLVPHFAEEFFYPNTLMRMLEARSGLALQVRRDNR